MHVTKAILAMVPFKGMEKQKQRQKDYGNANDSKMVYIYIPFYYQI